ncbi:MAG TPA: hypothetical protein DIT07_11795 [Sphingobacteriaceae bacterium]|nr:hypothetical protein [Sphingobacteriaceae bacterium]
MYRYLFEKFRKHAKNDKKIYIITAAYCNLAFHVAKDKSDAIMYPSIPAIEKGMNFAFNKDISTQSFLKLESVSRNELTAKIGNKGVINFAESGILHAASFETSTNKIIW